MAQSDVHCSSNWVPVIGLETHVQLKTASKLFSPAATVFRDTPNTHVDPVVLGLPGTLPVLNEKALEYAVKGGLAIHCSIAAHSKFDRKQYFYPDLPKNDQISQYDQPIAEDGWVNMEVAEKGKATYNKRIGIERLHMGEDAGKLLHGGADQLSGSTHSLVDTIGPVCRWLGISFHKRASGASASHSAGRQTLTRIGSMRMCYATLTRQLNTGGNSGCWGPVAAAPGVAHGTTGGSLNQASPNRP